MLQNYVQSIAQSNTTALVLFSISIILFAGFLSTRVTKMASLPNVTGYILAGVLAGPHVFKLIPQSLIDKMAFMSDIALAFIAFSVGKFFKKEAFQSTGLGIITITLFESLLAGVLITLSMYFLLGLDFKFSLLLGAIATATAPASTIVTVRQYKAKGPFVNTLLQVVAFDDAVCLIVFSIAIAIINSSTAETFHWLVIALPIFFNILVLAISVLLGVLLKRLITPNRSKDNRLILPIALLMGLAGFCAALDISPLLACMVFGASYINLTGDKKLFKEIDKFTPPILAMFFTLSGMSLDLRLFKSLGIIGILYFAIRIIGKYTGAYLGCTIAKTSKEIRNYLGFALVPQAGVAIGLAFLGKRALPEEIGNMLLTIILSSSVLYELVGPASAKFALVHSGAIKPSMLGNSKKFFFKTIKSTEE